MLAAAAVVLGALQGCDEAGNPLPAGIPTDGGRPPIGGWTPGSPCTEGATDECHVTLGEHDGILSCAKGIQSCVGGKWGECSASDVYEINALPQNGTARTLALSNAAGCVNNPCNPSCREFVEVPEGGLTVTYSDAGGSATPDGGGPGSPYGWQGGTEFGYPPDLIGVGLDEPCDTRSDCQFNMRCIAPTRATCEHHQCDVGGPLVDGCNDCVTAVCAADTTCCAPPVVPACAHDPCVTGAGLPNSCDGVGPSSCVTRVNTAIPSCATTWTQSCVNAVATQCAAISRACGCGSGEAANGSQCYRLFTGNTSWTSAQSNCRARGAGWDLTTLSTSTENTFVRNLLQNDAWIGANDRTTEGTWRWSDSTAWGAYTAWASGEPNNVGTFGEDCGVMLLGSGGWNDLSCGSNRDYVCEGPPNVLSPTSFVPTETWSQACVDAVATVCGATCQGNPPEDDGLCEPWYPGQTDPTCAGIDLGVGFSCDSGGGAVVPICNHGTQDLAPGTSLKLVHFPPGSGLIRDPSPDMTLGTTCNVTTSEILRGGWCINISAAECPGLTDGAEIMVNPGDGTEIAECSLEDNWALFYSAPCGTPTCSGNSSRAQLRPVNMVIIVDTSASMQEDPAGNSSASSAFTPPNRWVHTTSALKTFFADPTSDGLRVALDFFPGYSPKCGDDGTTTGCDPNACEPVTVAKGELDVAFRPTDSHEQALIDAVDAMAPIGGGGTPIYPAMLGAYQWTQAQQAQAPNEIYVVVLVTDGDPNRCDDSGSGPTANTPANIAALAGAVFANTGIRTYAIGIQGIAPATLDSIAASGGGASFFASAASGNVGAEILAAFQQISASAVECDFALPNPGDFDPTLSTVRYVPGGTQTLDIGPYCAYGETQFGDACYMKSLNSVRTWAAAQASCQARGSGWTLAAVDSADENAALTSLAAGSQAWIGYTDSATEGTFVWENGQCSGYSNWGGGLPNNAACTLTACSMIQSGGGWTDSACSGVSSYDYYCEGPNATAQGLCAAGQVQGPDSRCYRRVTTGASYTAAATACAGIGTGWALATVPDQSVNDFLVGQIGCNETWIGAPLVYTHFAAGEPNGVAGTNCTRMTGNGTWRDDNCAAAAEYVCAGPLPGASPPSCPAGQTMWGNGCYVKPSTGANTWTAARTACQALGGNLVAISSTYENGAVAGLNITANTWIGVNDVTTESTFAWSNAECPGYTNWSGLGSNNSLTNDWGYIQTAGTWRLHDGSAGAPPAAMPYVCEMPRTNAQGRCGAGEVEGPDSTGAARCYRVITTGGTWTLTAAGTACAGLGAGWGLATLTTNEEIGFAADRLSESGGCNTYTWRAGGRISPTGVLGTTASSTTHQRALCQGGTVLPVAPACPAGYDSFGGHCYVNPAGTTASWTTARDSCRGIGTGWDLVAVDSAEENAFVDARVTVSSAWIGRSGTFAWAWSNSQCTSYENWASGEGVLPDCSPWEDCTRLQAAGTWNDTTCVEPSTAYPYLCEGPLQNAVGRCAAGQTEGPTGYCYQLIATPTAGSAVTCPSGMSLAAAATATERQFLASLVTCAAAWIDGSGASASWLAGEPNQATGCTTLLDDGTMRDDLCSVTQGYVCEGPLLPPPAPPSGVTLTGVAPSDADGDGVPDACTGNDQWYFDDPANPGLATLCPSTCNRVRNDPGANIAIEIGCYPSNVPATDGGAPPAPLVTSHYQSYQADCAPEMIPLWDYLGYEVSTPGDSRVEFRARTGASDGGPTGAFTTIATVQDPAPDVCPLTGPAPCPVEIFDVLSAAEVRQRALELEIVLVPGSSGEVPSVLSWGVTFSCIDGR